MEACPHSGMQGEPQQEHVSTLRVLFILPLHGPLQSSKSVITIYKEDAGALREAVAEIPLKYRWSNTGQREGFTEFSCLLTAQGLSSKEDQLWGLFPKDDECASS